MQNPQSFYPSSPRKELDRATVTQTHTHTDHVTSNFDHFHDEVTTQGMQRNQRFTNQTIHPLDEKTLTKVRSMPHTQFAQYKTQQARGSVGDVDFQKTAFNNAAQNSEFNAFSPIPNRVKPNELNQTLNTNVESREYVAQHNTPNHTPKMIQKSTSGFLPQQAYNFQPREVRPGTTVLSQQNEVPVSNQRVSFQTNDFIPQMSNVQNNMPRASSSMNVVNRPSINALNQASFNVQQSNIIPLDSRNVQKSNLTAAETGRQYQSIIIDQLGNQVTNPLTDQRSRQHKFTFTSDTIHSPHMGTIQEYQQVQIQRPDYRKIYNNKGEHYRTVGPQEDYFKQEKTCFSKLLPILGILALLMLIGGTLLGLGVMTGLIGGKNYLSKAQSENIQKLNAGDNNRNGFVTNEVEDGNVGPVLNTTTIVAPPLIPTTTVVVPSVVKNNTTVIVAPPIVELPKVENVTVTEPVIPTPSPINNKPIQTPTFKPVQPEVTKIQPVLVPVQPAVAPVQSVIQKPSVPIAKPVVQPVVETVPEPAIQPVTQPVVVPVIKPVVVPVIQPTIEPQIKPTVVPEIKPVALPTTAVTQPEPVKKPEVTYIKSTETIIIKPAQNKIQPSTIEPVVVPTKIEPLQPTVIQPVKVEPIVKPVETIGPTIIEPVKPVTVIEPSVIPAVVQPTVVKQPTTQPTKPIQIPVIEPTIVIPTIQPTVTPTTQPTVTPTTQPTVTLTTQPTVATISEPIRTPTKEPTSAPITKPTVTQPTEQPAVPISTEQALKVINIIIEQNNNLIPLNFKTTIKQDILNEFETVPLKFRDFHQVQLLTLKHIDQLKGTTLHHRKSLTKA